MRDVYTVLRYRFPSFPPRTGCYLIYAREKGGGEAPGRKSEGAFTNLNSRASSESSGAGGVNSLSEFLSHSIFFSFPRGRPTERRVKRTIKVSLFIIITRPMH